MTDLTLSLTRHMTARPETIWTCMTDPDLIARWFAPSPVSVSAVEIDPTPGGIFRVAMQVPEVGEMDGGAGCILVAEPNKRLIWTSALAPGFGPKEAAAEGAFHFTAILSLEDLGDGATRYTATALHAYAAAKAAHAEMGFDGGWGTMAEQLGQLAASM